MAGRLLPRLWVLLSAVLLFPLVMGDGGVLRQVESRLFQRWLRAFHPGGPPWPKDFVTVPIDSDALATMTGDPTSLVRKEDSIRIWDRLHALGASVILFDLKFPTRRPEVDGAVIEALPRDRVFLPITTAEGPPKASAAPGLVDASGVGFPVAPISSLEGPFEEFASAAAGLGHVQVLQDPDGIVRQLVPAYDALPDGRVMPSLALAGLARQRGADLRTIGLEDGSLVVDGLPSIPLDRGRLILELTTVGLPPAVTVRDLFDPRKETAARKAIEGKLVLIYLAGGTDVQPTLLGPNTAAGLLHAHAIRQLSAGHAPWFPPVKRVLLPLFVALLVVAGPIAQFTPRNIAIVAFGAIVLWVWMQIAVYRKTDVFLPIMMPATLIAFSAVGLIVNGSSSFLRRAVAAEARADAANAPTGEIALVFTDVQGSTRLWEKVPDAMRAGLVKHNDLLRERIVVWRGYEVKTEGDAFMLAFGDPTDALMWCLDVQSRLLTVEWPDALLAEPDAASVTSSSGAFLWRGLRVRMGIHVGTPEPRVDPKTGRMDYFGPVVNKAARVSGMAHGGQIVLSGSAWEKLAAVAMTTQNVTTELGTFALKGISTPETLRAVLPQRLEERTFESSAKVTGESKAAEPAE